VETFSDIHDECRCSTAVFESIVDVSNVAGKADHYHNPLGSKVS